MGKSQEYRRLILTADTFCFCSWFGLVYLYAGHKLRWRRKGETNCKLFPPDTEKFHSV